MKFIFEVGQLDSLIILEALWDYEHNEEKHEDDRKAAKMVSRKLEEQVKKQWKMEMDK